MAGGSRLPGDMLRTRHIALLTFTLLLPARVVPQCNDDAPTYSSAVIPDYFFDFGEDAGDTLLQPGMGEVSPKIEIPMNFPFFFQNQHFVHVSANGLISFDIASTGQKDVIGFPKNNLRFIAPFWSDIDTSKNHGSLYFRANSTDSVLLEKVSSYIQDRFVTSSRFSASWVLIATWSNVTHAAGNCSTEVNTFQAVLATNGRYSFVFFLYAQLDWLRAADTDFYPVVGLNMDRDNHFQLPNSGGANVGQLLTSSNIDINGFWLFRVDEKTVVSKACDDEGDFLRSSPMLASPRGGTRLLLSGPCLQSSMILLAKIDEVEVSATFINKYMAEVFTPSLYYEGEALVELSTDNGLTYSTNTTITIVDDHQVLPTVTRVDPKKWDNSSSVSITWEPSDLQDIANVNIYFSTLTKNSEDEVVEILYLLSENQPNDGDATLALNRLTLVEDDELVFVTHGAILVRASDDNSGERTQIYSDIHVAKWMSLLLLKEIAIRNRQRINDQADSQEFLQNQIWDTIATYFADVDDNAELEENVRSIFENMAGVMLDAIGRDKCDDYTAGQTPVSGLMAPPCTMKQAEADPRWVTDQYCRNGVGALCHQNLMHNCVIQSQANSSGSQKSCYDSNGYILESVSAAGISSGYPLAAHPHGLRDRDGTSVMRWQVDHLRDDIEPFVFCCVWSGKNGECSKFANLRPVSTCENYQHISSGGVGGDPHFQTFDGFWYTFNGIGEYVLTKHQDGFEVQTRLVQRGSSKASVIQAVAFKAGGSDVIEVRSVSSRLQVLFQSKPQDLGCCSVLHFKGGKAQLDMSEAQPSSVNITFRSGEFVRVMLMKETLQIIIIPLVAYNGNLQGLLGNYDDNPKNDFQPKSGDDLTETASPQEIHMFGETWRTEPNESLFTYPVNEDHGDYQDDAFEPTFISPSIGIPLFCKGNLQCAYDYHVTGDMELAMGTLSFITTLETYYNDSSSGRRCPEINLANGESSATKRWVRATVTLTCNEKYFMMGSARRTCQRNATWSGVNTRCALAPSPCVSHNCQNNGTCELVEEKPVCKCTSNYGGDLCERRNSDTLPFILIGVVAGVLALAGLIVATLLFLKCRPKEEPLIANPEYKYKYPYGPDSMPIFRGTLANRSGRYGGQGQGMYNRGYTPYPGIPNDPYYERRPKHDRHGDGRHPPIPPSPYPHFGNSHKGSDSESSIDKIYRGEVPSKYRSSPVPDYDREYTSHIEASRGGHSRAPSSHGRSSYKGKGHQMKSSRAAGSSEHNMFGSRTGKTEANQFGGY